MTDWNNDPDDELVETDPDVIGILGFDPAEEDAVVNRSYEELIGNAGDCGANAPGGGGFQPGNDCAKGGGGGGYTASDELYPGSHDHSKGPRPRSFISKEEREASYKKTTGQANVHPQTGPVYDYMRYHWEVRVDGERTGNHIGHYKDGRDVVAEAAATHGIEDLAKITLKSPDEVRDEQAADLGMKPVRMADLPSDVFEDDNANKYGRDTMEVYRARVFDDDNPNSTPESRYADQGKLGDWTPARAALHEKIVAQHFEGKTPVENSVAYLTGGGPASGKSGAMKMGFVTPPANTVHIDADEIKNSIPEYKAALENKESKATASTFVHEESSYLSKRIAAEASAKGYNVMLDGTGDSGIESISRKVATMRAGGAKSVEAVYVTASVETAIARNLDRAQKIGRLVPEPYLRATHAGVSRTLPKALEAGLFDRVALYDTESGKPKLVVSQERGGTYQVHDAMAWNDFLLKGEE